jgi:hypothetical protein
MGGGRDRKKIGLMSTKGLLALLHSIPFIKSIILEKDTGFLRWEHL